MVQSEIVEMNAVWSIFVQVGGDKKYIWRRAVSNSYGPVSLYALLVQT